MASQWVIDADELIIDSFAGGGGASTGIEMATGRSPDIAINHDAEALAMHRVNHPNTLHIVEDVWHVDFRAICAGRPIGLLWLSPDCTHFSKAKGGKPREKALRGLAWVSLKWVKSLPAWQRPRIVMLENVEEFQDWGPLTADNKPCRKQKGLFFQQFKHSFERLGYVVEARKSRAYEGGAPTIRQRLEVIMRRDGEAIVWPEPLFGDPETEAVKAGKVQPWRTAAECIDFTLPCPSIFATTAEIKADLKIRAKRPLAQATLARVAKGVKRYVLDAGKPFIVNLTHGGRIESADAPMRTVTGANRGEKAVVTPYLTSYYSHTGARSERVSEMAGPLATVTTENRHALIAPSLISIAHGYSGGRREYPITEPFGTITSGGISHAVVSPYLLSLKGSARRDGAPGAPHPTVCAGGLHSALVTPFLTKFRANAIGSAMNAPMPTVTANSWIKKPGGAVPIGIVVPHLMTMRNAMKPFGGADQPAHTITAGGAHLSLVSAFLVKNYSGELHLRSKDLREPIGAITAVDHHSLATPFMVKYYDTATAQGLAGPLHTTTAKARFGFAWPQLSLPPLTPAQEARARAVAAFLREHGCWDDREFVTVTIAGETYVMVDIGLRMLTPRELFRAQGFPENYVIDRGIDATGKEIKLSNTAQIEKCGNSVSPPWAAWHIRANFHPRKVKVPAPADAGPLFEGVAA